MTPMLDLEPGGIITLHPVGLNSFSSLMVDGKVWHSSSVVLYCCWFLLTYSADLLVQSC